MSYLDNFAANQQKKNRSVSRRCFDRTTL